MTEDEKTIEENWDEPIDYPYISSRNIMFRVIEYIMEHTEPERDRTCVLRVIERTTSLVRRYGGIGILKELHRAADAFISRLLCQISGDA